MTFRSRFQRAVHHRQEAREAGRDVPRTAPVGALVRRTRFAAKDAVVVLGAILAAAWLVAAPVRGVRGRGTGRYAKRAPRGGIAAAAAP